MTIRGKALVRGLLEENLSASAETDDGAAAAEPLEFTTDAEAMIRSFFEGRAVRLETAALHPDECRPGGLRRGRHLSSRAERRLANPPRSTASDTGSGRPSPPTDASDCGEEAQSRHAPGAPEEMSAYDSLASAHKQIRRPPVRAIYRAGPARPPVHVPPLARQIT